MPSEDLRFLHWARTERCTAVMDKRFDGYSSLQHIAAGTVAVAYGGHWRELGPGWVWPHHPGPRIALRPGAGAGWWTHRYVAVAGPLLEVWRREGLWPASPQEEPAGSGMAAAFDALIDLLPAATPMRLRRAVNRLEHILLALAEDRQDLAPPWMRRARSALAAPDGFRADIAAAAAAAGMPPSSFRRRFAALAGCSPQAYALAARMERARQLLADRDLPLAEVAERLGYRDSFFFSRQFRRICGIPPSAWRRSLDDLDA